ncbi:MAG: rod shape-determining protein MreD [Burkholderiaceae bacterium]|nr:rod shape-determining protein MreD [Burkholderiaceae bacterium]MCD6674640.1 rod shape-determining protein MreD [Burkholderiaceae bacterium]
MQMRPQYLLLPANRAFITFTIVAAFVLNVLPWGHAPGIPDLLALVLVFWNVHQPRMVGIGIAFLFGLLMDVHDAALFGEHALSYTLLSYGAIAMHRRVPWFHMFGQMLHVLPLFLLTQWIVLLVRLAIGGAFPGWQWFLQSASCTLLWPLADWLLLAPQRQAVDRDENRPI